ncbi:MAG: 4Fe-4S binding protein [Desulfovibrio sp.]|jgi:MauM/NapG family ferredoxin protein|nr:4Fe-4S binding protein [Desulfovibrio sp.]
MKKSFVFLRQRIIQALSLCCFLGLLYTAVWPFAEFYLPPDLYLRLDPLLATLVPLCIRDFPFPHMLPGLLLIFSVLLCGRIFCGYMCPMGITLDMGRFIGGFFCPQPKNKPRPPEGENLFSQHRHKVKYVILLIMVGAAMVGVNLIFWGSPIALITRFWALLMYPAVLLGAGQALDAGRPFFEDLGLNSLLYLSFEPRRYDSIYFVAAFFLSLFFLERVRPRFWCRYLCPAGAILGLASLRPGFRRRIFGCSGCGSCVEKCPAGAILPEGFKTLHSECITCMTCSAVCPVNGSVFSFSVPAELKLRGKSRATQDTLADAGKLPINVGDPSVNAQILSSGAVKPTGRPSARVDAFLPLPSRRAFLGAGVTGVALASLQYSGAHSLLSANGRGSLWAAGLLRPPGSCPEADFLDRCVRCGECMKACPNNALQPAGFEAGLEGLFSPLFLPRRGPCEPECNICGVVCPTGAIKRLVLEEKYQAKIGTAVVNKSRCVAWAENRRCVVCEETCPYASIKLVQSAGALVPAPQVDPMRCYGCGYCEHYCVTRLPSIVVEPLNALRLNSGSYRDQAVSLGLELSPGGRNKDDMPEKSTDSSQDLPPGFLPLD